MSDNIIQLNEDLIKNDLKDLVRSSMEETFIVLLDKEADELIGAQKYELSLERQGYRSGHYNECGEEIWCRYVTRRVAGSVDIQAVRNMGIL